LPLFAAGVLALLSGGAMTARAEEPAHAFFTTSDGVRLHYMRLGAQGSWVVLIHGYTGSAEGNWFANGIAQALAARHRVVAIDNRNHGRSDKPQPRGPGRAKDTIELMDHLGIDRAHIHGYSMGGAITARLLASHPARFVTASFGGSGVRETDEAIVARVPADAPGPDPEEAEASRRLRVAAAMNNGMSREQAEQAAAQPRAPRPPPSEAAAAALRDAARQGPRLDLRSVTVPVLAINGEFDGPYAKTHRLWRELRDFTNVVLPGKSHLTAIMPGYMPPEYTRSLVRFVDANDG
jgi:pimeloyl-ACP methyl ester carboxylesterase